MTRETIKLEFEILVCKAQLLRLVYLLIVDSGLTLKYCSASTAEVLQNHQDYQFC